jgi:hypothetical protein
MINVPNKHQKSDPQAQNYSSKFYSSFDSLGGENEFTAFYITAANINSCPRIDVTFGHEITGSLFDIGANVSIISENLYKERELRGVTRHEISNNNAVLITTFSDKSNMLERQCYFEFGIGDYEFRRAFFVAPQLLNVVILDCDSGSN